MPAQLSILGLQRRGVGLSPADKRARGKLVSPDIETCRINPKIPTNLHCAFVTVEPMFNGLAFELPIILLTRFGRLTRLVHSTSIFYLNRCPSNRSNLTRSRRRTRTRPKTGPSEFAAAHPSLSSLTRA